MALEDVRNSPDGQIRSGSTGSGPSDGGSCVTGAVVGTVGVAETSAAGGAGAAVAAVAAAAGNDEATSAAGSVGCGAGRRAAAGAAAVAGGPRTLLLLAAGSAGRCAEVLRCRRVAGGEGERRRLRSLRASADRSRLRRGSSRRRWESYTASLPLPLPLECCLLGLPQSAGGRFGTGLRCLRRLAPTAGLDAFCKALAVGPRFVAGLRCRAFAPSSAGRLPRGLWLFAVCRCLPRSPAACVAASSWGGERRSALWPRLRRRLGPRLRCRLRRRSRLRLRLRLGLQLRLVRRLRERRRLRLRTSASRITRLGRLLPPRRPCLPSWPSCLPCRLGLGELLRRGRFGDGERLAGRSACSRVAAGCS